MVPHTHGRKDGEERDPLKEKRQAISYLDSYIANSENLSLIFSFGLSWIPAGVYPDGTRGRDDKTTKRLSFP